MFQQLTLVWRAYISGRSPQSNSENLQRRNDRIILHSFFNELR